MRTQRHDPKDMAMELRRRVFKGLRKGASKKDRKAAKKIIKPVFGAMNAAVIDPTEKHSMAQALKGMFDSMIKDGCSPPTIKRVANEMMEVAGDVLLKLREAEKEHAKDCPHCKTRGEDEYKM